MIDKINLRKSYKFYKSTNKDGVAELVYLRIVTGYMLYIVRKVCQGWQAELAGGKSLGTLAIVFKKRLVRTDENGELRGQKNLINWGATNKMHKENPDAKGYIYYTNDHTNGFRASVVWWKTGMNVGNKYLYSFISSMTLKKLMTKYIRDGAEYINAEPNHVYDFVDDRKVRK